MDFEKAKQIRNELSNFLPCYKHAFIAPLEQDKLKSYLEMARNYNKTPKPLVGLLTDNSIIEKFLTEKYSNAELEVYVVSKHFASTTKPQPFREYILMEEIDFNVNKYI
jgi:hypothetical protein